MTADRDGFLTLENFLEFYHSACKQRPHVVWNNLASHHYRNDLKKPTEIEEEKIDVQESAQDISLPPTKSTLSCSSRFWTMAERSPLKHGN